jgi:hypothetical protein
VDGDEIHTIDDSRSVLRSVQNKLKNKFTHQYQNIIVSVQNLLANS